MSILTNQILNADCLKSLPMLPDGSIHFILTDPPYITRYQSRDERRIANDDNDAWLKPAFAEMYRVLKPDSFAVSFYGWPMADRFMEAYRAAGFRVVGQLMFPKSYASSTRYLRYQHEAAHLLAKGTPWRMRDTISDVIEWKYSGNNLYPTQKPVEVLQKLISAFCPAGGLVLDPFAGSGSTLAAAQMLGRRWLGKELDAHLLAHCPRAQGEAFKCLIESRAQAEDQSLSCS